MVYTVLGVSAFLFYILYDVNSVIWKLMIFRPAFFLGSVLLGVSVAGIIWSSRDEARPLSAGTVLLAGLMIIFLLLLIYSLFFAIPFIDTYIGHEENAGGPHVCSKGVYGLCRHPVMLWMAGMFITLGLEFPTAMMICGGTLFCVMNLLYIIIQDRWTFPRIFSGYEQYKMTVPFLIPTGKSIRRCFSTLKG